MFTGPVGPVEVFFYLPKPFLEIFNWPGAIGSLLASSPGTIVNEDCNWPSCYAPWAASEPV